ncbi:MAG: undecaprenyl-diphosphate phosphatase, partial [Clostridiales Family XIII bacterium]|jgi:undecaprenyl-diphosphatase|nr:undecaprenyl-diphosphate phosphatase [Clostridiales Family XIII bacterium]
MTFLESVVLGLAQGLSEFLPISSSGHLALLEYFFGIDEDRVLFFAALLHLGTLFSIFFVYHKEIWALLRELGAVFADLFAGRGPRVNANETRRLGFMILVATVPTALVGLFLRDLFSELYGSLVAVGAGLLITGSMMFVSERMARGARDLPDLRFAHAFFVGVMQSIALCPGISRSGATITGGLASGMKRELAVRFAFLISIPSVIGAILLEAPEAFAAGAAGATLPSLGAGVAVAMLSGFFAIKAMIRVVSLGRLRCFSFYTWALGAAVIAYALFL